MRRIPDELRENIARNLRSCRLKKFPGRGGRKKCAEALGVSQQQWSPWERGVRTPDKQRLIQLSEFFEVSVDWLKADNSVDSLSSTESVSKIAGIDFPPPCTCSCHLGQSPSSAPCFSSPRPGSSESFFWLFRHFVVSVIDSGVRIDKQSLDYILKQFH